MENRAKKLEDAKCGKINKDSGENMLNKVDGINRNFIQARDRGDSQSQSRNFYKNPVKTIPNQCQRKTEGKNEESLKTYPYKEEAKEITEKRRNESEGDKLRSIDAKVLTNIVDERLFAPVVMSDKKIEVKPNKTLSQVGANRTYLDSEGRKLLRERYTVKLRSTQSSNKTAEANDIKIYLRNDTKRQTYKESNGLSAPESTKEIGQAEPVKPIKRIKEPQFQSNRKPIVKTIRLPNDRVYKDYKAVTFTDEKESTPLQINIPSDGTKGKTSVETNLAKSKLKPVISKVSVQTKTSRKKKGKARPVQNRPHSPVIKTNRSTPQTEVSQWVPAISRYNKSCYEAWVDTTMVSKSSDTDKSLPSNKSRNLLQTFKRALELEQGQWSPDLVYEKSNDVRYTGKITVRKSNAKSSSISK